MIGLFCGKWSMEWSRKWSMEIRHPVHLCNPVLRGFDEWNDWFIHQMYFKVVLSAVCEFSLFPMVFLCLTHALVWRDSSTSVARGIHMCDTIHSPVSCDSVTYVTWLSHMHDKTHSHVWHSQVTYVTWLSHRCDITQSHMWHDLFTRVTWRIHICGVTHSYVARPIHVWDTIHSYVWCANIHAGPAVSARSCDLTHAHEWLQHTDVCNASFRHVTRHMCVTPHIHTCDATHSYADAAGSFRPCDLTHSHVRHDSYLMGDMTHTYVWNGSFIRDTTCTCVWRDLMSHVCKRRATNRNTSCIWMSDATHMNDACLTPAHTTKHTYIFTYIYMHSYRSPRIHSNVYTYIHTQTCMHTHIHTYTCAHTCIWLHNQDERFRLCSCQ